MSGALPRDVGKRYAKLQSILFRRRNFFNSLSLVRPMKSSRFGLGLRSTVMNVQSFKASLPVMG